MTQPSSSAPSSFSPSSVSSHDPLTAASTTPLQERVAALVGAAGYRPADRVVVGVQRGDEPPAFVAHGAGTDGDPVGPASVVCTASIAKQVTAVCAALLVRQGRLDLGSTLGEALPELPAWAAPVRLRHLLSHTSGLPEVAGFDELHGAGLDRTTARVVDALVRADGPLAEPGSEHRYCNAGYVCLAVAVERAAGRRFADLAQELVLGPLGMASSRFWSGPAAHPPGAVALEPAHPAPLSCGDGGLWSSAADLLRWNRAMLRDELGVADLVQTPGRLDDGTLLDYAGGLGVREHAGRVVHRHGGRWAGLCAQLVRLAASPDAPGASLVVLALDDDEERADALADALLSVLAGPTGSTGAGPTAPEPPRPDPAD